MKHLLCSVLFLGGVAASASAQEQQFVLRSGSVQIGSAPGRVSLARPTVRTLTLGTRVQFAVTVDALQGADPCGGTPQCVATVGLRSYSVGGGNPFTESWSTFTLPSDLGNRALTLDLPSTAPTNVLPRGRCDLLVSIARGRTVLFEHSVPVVVE